MFEFDPEEFHTTPFDPQAVEPGAAQREGAATMYELFASFRGAGFTEEQSMSLVGTVLQETMRRGQGDG